MQTGRKAGGGVTYPALGAIVASMKKKDYEVVQMLAERFKAETGSLLCKDLLGLNKQRADGTLPEIVISATPEARTDEYYKKRPCIRMVETAIGIYMRYLEELPK